jgi:hypothetical protein
MTNFEELINYIGAIMASIITALWSGDKIINRGKKRRYAENSNGDDLVTEKLCKERVHSMTTSLARIEKGLERLSDKIDDVHRRQL